MAHEQPEVYAKRGKYTIYLGSELRDDHGKTFEIKMADGKVISFPLTLVRRKDDFFLANWANPKRSLAILDWHVSSMKKGWWTDEEGENNKIEKTLSNLHKITTGDTMTRVFVPELQKRVISVFQPSSPSDVKVLAIAQEALVARTLDPDTAISVSVQSAVCVVPNLYEALMGEPSWASQLDVVVSASAWLSRLQIPVVSANYEESRSYYFSLSLFSIAAKGYQSAQYITSLGNRFGTFCAMSGVAKIEIVPNVQNLTQIGDFLSQDREAMASLTRFVLQAARPDSVTRSLLDQAQLCLTFGGLQGMRMAHEFVLNNTSAIWTLDGCVDQANHLEATWEEFITRENYPFARMLGQDDPNWSQSKYPDILWCAKEAAMAHQKGMDAFNITNLTTLYSQDLLKRMLGEELEHDAGGLSEKSASFMSKKGLKRKVQQDASAILEKLMMHLSTARGSNQ